MNWKTESAIAKRCPNGYHKDENGNCIDANGNYYQGKQEQVKQDSVPSKEKTSESEKPSTDKLDSLSYEIESFLTSSKKFTQSELPELHRGMKSAFKKGDYSVALNRCAELQSRLGLFIKDEPEVKESLKQIREYIEAYAKKEEKEKQQKYKKGEKEHPEWTKEQKMKNRVRNFFEDVGLDDGEFPFMLPNGTPVAYHRDSGVLYLWTKRQYNVKGERTHDSPAYHWEKIRPGTKSYGRLRDNLEGIEDKSEKSVKKMWKTESAIAKRCPNGYHKDENGNCIDANGNYYQGKQEQPDVKQPRPKKEINEQKVGRTLSSVFESEYKWAYNNKAVRNKVPSDFKEGWCDYDLIVGSLRGKNVKRDKAESYIDYAEKKGLIEVKRNKKTHKPIQVRPKNWKEYVGRYNLDKMKKGHGNYMDAIENFIVDDCPNGCYYNEIYDNFCDALEEDDIMDAIATLEDDGIIRYNENNERYEVCAKAKKSASAKKSKIKKTLDCGISDSEFQRVCPHATRYMEGIGSMDVVWDLPSGNHPGIYLSSHGSLEEPVYVVWMTAWNHLDYREPNTPDGELPSDFRDLAQRIHDRVKQGNYDGGPLPTKQEVLDWLREMDNICDVQAELTANKSAKKKVTKDMDIYSPPSGRFCVHRSLNGESFYPKYYDDEGRFSQVCQDFLDSGYEERDGDRYTDENGMTHRYFERWDKSVDKSYSPNYVGFKDMVSTMRNTRDNSKVFKE